MTTEIVESIPAEDLPAACAVLPMRLTVNGTEVSGTVAEIVQQAYQIGWQTGADAERDAMLPEIERVARLLKEYLAGHPSASAQPITKSVVIHRDDSGKMLGMDIVGA